MSAALRYVILHHTGHGPDHFDLLFEMDPRDGALSSFRCPRWPLVVGDRIEELPLHRRAYLDYEGPISGDRGTVTRVEAGEVQWRTIIAEQPTIALKLTAGDAVHALAITHRFIDGDPRNTLWTVEATTGVW